MRKSIFILLLVAAAMSLSVARKLSDSERLRFQYFAMEGIKQRLQGNAAAAADLFSHALAINPEADELVYAMAKYYDGVDDSLYISHVRRAIELDTANSTYLTELAAYYIKTEDYPQAISILEQNYRNGVNKAGVLDLLVRLYYATDDYDKAIDALNRIETKEGQSVATTLKKMQLYEARGDTTATYELLRGLAADNDDEPYYKTMLGNWLVQKGKGDEARPYLEEAVSQAPDDYNALMSLYDYYKSSDNDSLAQHMADRVLRSANTPQKDRARFMGNCMRGIYNQKEEGDTAAAFAFFDQLLEENPHDSLAAYFRVSLMQTLDYPSDSILPAMDQYFAIVPDDPEMRLQQAQLYALDSEWEKTLDATRLGLEYNPDELVFYYFNAISLVQLDRDKEAVDVVRDGLRRRGEGTNDELVADCYSMLGDMLYQQKDMAGSFEAYDSCLAYKPDHTSALNNYAYYLSLSARDLKKAELMSYQTVVEEPNSSTYLDTYAWILFQQGRFDDAQTYIDRAITVIEDDAREELIAGHLRMEYASEAMPEIDLANSDDSLCISEGDSIGAIYAETDTVPENYPDSVDYDSDGHDSASDFSPTPEDIHRLVTYDSSNATIYEHAGDISYQNGLPDKAVELWQTAAECSKPDRLLQKKIKKQKYFPRKNPKI